MSYLFHISIFHVLTYLIKYIHLIVSAISELEHEINLFY
jgi:hypothetical protein